MKYTGGAPGGHKIDIDGVGGLWLLPFAKRQLNRFKKLFPFGVRRFHLPDGEEVTIWWGGYRDRIRIVVAIEFDGRYRVEPFWYLNNDKFAEDAGNALFQTWWSRDGTTLAYTDRIGAEEGVNRLTAVRDNLTPAFLDDVAVSGENGQNLFNTLINRHFQESATDGDPSWVWPIATSVFTHSDGLVLFARAAITAGVRVFDVGVTPEVEPTATTLVQRSTEDVPQFVLDFYTGQSVPHALDLTTGPGNYRPLIDRRSTTSATPFYWSLPVIPYATGLNALAANLTVAGRDYQAELPVSVFSMPFAQSVVITPNEPDPPNVEVTIGVRWEMRRFNLTTNDWDLMYGRTELDVLTFSYTESDGTMGAVAYTFEGDPVHASYTKVAGANHATRTLTITPTGNPLGAVRVTGNAGAQQVFVGDILVAGAAPGDDGATTLVPQAVAASGALVAHSNNNQFWHGSWGEVEAGFSVPAMSPDGTALWVGSDSPGNPLTYYENGVLLYTSPSDPPLTGVLSPGVHTVYRVHGWSYERDAVKAVISHEVVESSPGVFQNVQRAALIQWNGSSFDVLKLYPGDLVLHNPGANSFAETVAIQDEFLL